METPVGVTATSKVDAPNVARRERLLYGGITLALALVFLPVVLHPTEVLYHDISDLLSSHLPYRHLLADSLRELGRIPRYNPTAFGGIPLVGDPQAGLVYPPNWLHAIGSEGGGPAWFGWLILLHLCVGAWGVSHWLRGNGHGAAARLAGALTFALAGKWLYHVVVPGHIIFAPLAWVPWQLAFIDRLEGPRSSPATACALLAAATALAITGLHPQLLLYSQTVVFFYAIVWLARQHRAANVARVFGWLAGAAILSAGLAAVHLLPIFDSLGLFVRGDGLLYETAATRSLSFPEFAGLLLPSQAPGMWEPSVFLGAFAMTLAAFSPWRRAQRGTTIVFVLILAGTLLYALGDNTPFHRWLFETIPGYDLFRLPRRILLVAGIPLAYLAASGLEALCESPPTRSKRLLAAVGIGAALWLLSVDPSEETLWAVAALTFPALCLAPWPPTLRPGLAGLAVVLVFSDGARFIAHRIETRPLEEIIGVNRVAGRIAGPLGRGRVLALNKSDPRELSALTPIYATPAGIENLRGYNPLIPRATYQYLIQGVAQRPLTWRAATAIPSNPIRSREHLDLFNTRWVVTYLPQHVEGLELREVIEKQRLNFFQAPGILSAPRTIYIYENMKVLPRAYLVRAARHVNDVDEAIATISRFDPRREVLVEDSALAERSYPGTFVAVDVAHRGDEIEIDVDAERGGFLVLSEIAYPGWRVEDDGVPLPIHRANGIFQTVELGPGHHSLHFEYLPRSFIAGRALSVASLALSIGMLAVGRRSAQRAQAT